MQHYSEVFSFLLKVQLWPIKLILLPTGRFQPQVWTALPKLSPVTLSPPCDAPQERTCVKGLLRPANPRVPLQRPSYSLIGRPLPYPWERKERSRLPLGANRIFLPSLPDIWGKCGEFKMERRLGEKRRLLSDLQRVVMGEGKLDVLGARIMADGWVEARGTGLGSRWVIDRFLFLPKSQIKFGLSVCSS